MVIFEIGTGYTSIPAKIGAATEIVIEELAKAFQIYGENVKIVDIEDANRAKTELPIIEVPMPKKFNSTDTSLGIMHKIKRVIYSINLARKLKKIVEDNERCIFHIHNQYNMFFTLKILPKSLRMRCKIFYTNHSYVWHGDWELIKSTIKKKYFQEIECMKKADAVFVLNEKAKDNIVKYIGISESKVYLIDNGVNTDIYFPVDNKNKLKLKYGFCKKKIYVQVGSVCERKNQMEAIELLTPYIKADKNIVFCYAGGIIDHEYKDKIDKFVMKNGICENVKYLGELRPGSDLNDIYNLGDAMLFPSKAEGFSLVILETMAAGTPVVIKSELKFKMSDCCMRYNSKEQFNELMDKIADPQIRREMSVKCRNKVIEQYSWKKVALDYLKIFEK